MAKQKITYLLLSAVSLTISLFFIGTGIAISSDEAPLWFKAYGYLTVGYGLISAALLIIAWKKDHIAAQSFSKYVALGFLASFIITSLDVGIISGLEWIGIIIVGLLVWVQWYSVKLITKRKMHNQPVHSDAPKSGA